jgi:hypothetical protein
MDETRFGSTGWRKDGDLGRKGWKPMIACSPESRLRQGIDRKALMANFDDIFGTRQIPGREDDETPEQYLAKLKAK